MFKPAVQTAQVVGNDFSFLYGQSGLCHSNRLPRNEIRNFDVVAGRINVFVRSLHMVVDLNAAAFADFQIGHDCQFRIGTNGGNTGHVVFDCQTVV